MKIRGHQAVGRIEKLFFLDRLEQSEGKLILCRLLPWSTRVVAPSEKEKSWCALGDKMTGFA